VAAQASALDHFGDAGAGRISVGSVRSGRQVWPGHVHGRVLLNTQEKPSLSGPNEGEQVGIKSLGIDLGQPVATALVNLQFRALDDLCCLLGGSCNRHDLVVITVDHKRRLIYFSEIAAIVNLWPPPVLFGSAEAPRHFKLLLWLPRQQQPLQ
jgi:hypothetical protein